MITLLQVRNAINVAAFIVARHESGVRREQPLMAENVLANLPATPHFCTHPNGCPTAVSIRSPVAEALAGKFSVDEATNGVRLAEWASLGLGHCR
jgi:hypothetical protein